MSRHTEILEMVKAQGLRLTPQRLIILSAIAEGEGHMNVDEVYRRARLVYPYMDIATVYRTLHLFKRLRLVTEVGMGDRLHYELTDPNARHHHMVCRACGKAFNLSPSYLDEFRTRLSSEFGFEPDLDNFTVTGTCSGCQSINESNGKQQPEGLRPSG
jgi:Fe2+ or Zn2+ uptake regulation protein